MKTSEPKPTKEEILKSKFKSSFLDLDYLELYLEAMQEYAEEYHKEKLKDELVKFTIFISEMDYKDAAAERVINEYLKTKE